ncbi:MAG: hypothetical protein WCS96_00065 [Victivallales bacterium]
MNKELMKSAVVRNLEWFKRSGVMLPADGSWGVAERVAVAQNEAIEEMLKAFPAWTKHDNYYIIEQRRADCCFEAAWYFLEAGRLDAQYRQIGENILDFLYFRSGLLNRYDAKYPIGSWNWSHIKWEPTVYFDDNSWCIFIQLAIAKNYPELDEKYRCTSWALSLADELAVAANRTFGQASASGNWKDPQAIWRGHYDLPHWGSLVSLALASANAVRPRAEYVFEIRRYQEHIAAEARNLIASEQAYALLACSYCAKKLGDSLYTDLAVRLGDLLMEKIDPDTGNLPAEHRESPVGVHLVDTIYTMNWAAMALQGLFELTKSSIVQENLGKMLQLLLKIQDFSTQDSFAGCWRGMYDLNAKTWGGGDRYEGGSGSIYTGWTNTTIGLTLLWKLSGKSLIS